MAIAFHAAPTSNCRRVALVLHELQLPFTLHLVDREAGMQHLPAFRAINPAGMVPVIVDPEGAGGDGRPVTVAQSGAILLYLAEKTGRLLPPAGAERVAVLQWLMHVLTDVNATASALFHARRAAARAADPVVAVLEQRLHAYLRDCSGPLRQQDYLAGGLSVADFALYPLLAAQHPFISHRPDLAALLAWQQRLAGRPSVVRGMGAL